MLVICLVFFFMAKLKPKTIDEILRKSDPEQTAVAERLRGIVKDAIPDVQETVRRGVITYVLNGKDFASINLLKDHIDVGLFAGARIDHKRLKGTGEGKDIKHIKIVSAKKLDEAEITRILKEAAAIV